MSEDALVAYGSPTLAGLKTGNLFSVPREEKHALAESIRRLNGCLVPRGVRLVVVRQTARRVLVYLYRPARLRRDWQDPLAREILSRRGYPVEDPERCVAQLARRLGEGEDFPHEIGLFLGYPPRDVAGFMADCEHPRCTGVWKVYSDVDQAKRTFALYDKCARLYREAWRRHGSFSRLVVRQH